MGKSFYGGMDGRPFILKKVYPTIPNMINMFKNEINYGEYVLISNDNRNHPDNGKLFKRVYAAAETDKIEYSFYNEDTHSFETTESTDVEMKYIGAIVGPQGSAVEFKILETNLESVKDEYQDLEMIQTVSELTPKTVKGTDKTKIIMNTYSFRDRNGNKSTVYLDMTIPYNVIEWTTTQLPSQEKVDILQRKINPFYQWYKLGIPKGQDGTSFNNIRVITPTAADDVVTISFDEDRNITVTKYNGLQDDIDNQRQIWVADVTDYKVTDDGTKYLVYLGDYNIINDITIDEKGTITIKYNHNNNSVWDEKLTWIEGASITNGHLDIETNNEKNEIHKQLNWPINIAIDPEDGTVTYTDVEVDENGNNKTYSQDSLTWVKNLTIDDKGVLNTFTTTGENQIENKQLQWVKDIQFNNENGTVTIIYIDDTEEKPHREIYSNLVDWIKEIKLDTETGELTITSNNGDIDYNTNLTWVKNLAIDEKGVLNTTTTTGENQIENQQLHWIKDISIDGESGAVTYTEVDEKTQKTQHLRWVKDINITDTGYLNIETTTEVNETHRQLHWVKDISINPDTGVVTYTDISGSTTTEILDWVKDISIDEEGTITIDYTNSENTVYSKLIDWIKEVSISQDGTVSIESNNGTQLLSPNQQKLKWLENVSLAQDGTFTKTDNQNVSVNQEQKLKWVDGVSLSQDGTFTQSYNNGDEPVVQDTKLKWPVNISLNKNTGMVTTTYNDGSINETQNPQMDWITSASLDDNKMLSVEYVNAENIEVNLKTPNEVTLDSASGDIYIKYNTGENIAIGNIGENTNIASACAASEEEGAPETLKVGGIWFVTQDAE